MPLCPRCHNTVERSHTRGLIERLIKKLTAYRPYRCHVCDWRGMLRVKSDGGEAKREK